MSSSSRDTLSSSEFSNGNSPASSHTTQHSAGAIDEFALQEEPKPKGRTLKKMLSRLGTRSTSSSKNNSPVTSPSVSTDVFIQDNSSPVMGMSGSSSFNSFKSTPMNGNQSTSTAALASPLGISGVSNGQDSSYFASSQQPKASSSRQYSDRDLPPLPPKSTRRPTHERNSKVSHLSSSTSSVKDSNSSSRERNHTVNAVPLSNVSNASTGGSFAARLLRRVSSAPNTKALFNRTPPIEGIPFPAGSSSSRKQHLSPIDAESAFPSQNHPDYLSRDPSTSTSASSQHSPVSNRTRTKSSAAVSDSRQYPSRSATSPTISKLADDSARGADLLSPSSAYGSTSSPDSPRAGFRRTYSSNSIKTREVEVGPSSFSKIKLLGKGDVGKVYLVREKKTERLYAMKVLNKREMIKRNKIKRALAEQVRPLGPRYAVSDADCANRKFSLLQITPS